MDLAPQLRGFHAQKNHSAIRRVGIWAWKSVTDSARHTRPHGIALTGAPTQCGHDERAHESQNLNWPHKQLAGVSRKIHIS
jgi:hypothetical protein